MRKMIAAGNWKMNKTNTEAVEIVSKLNELIADVKGVEVIIGPPFTALSDVKKVAGKVKVAAQNMHWEEKGAFTGATTSEEGLIRQADGSTLFLDEVGELSLPMQKAFLRVLQERRFRPVGETEEIKSDFRLIAATNRNLEELIQENLFREDLFFRLKAITIELPSLRERPEDIKDIILYYIPRICEREGLDMKGFSPEFLEFLLFFL